MKRTRDDKPLDWEQCVGEEVVQQLSKLSGGSGPRPELKAHWHYEYVIAWLYNVCRSFYTAEEAGKPLWADVTFEEAVLTQDMMRDTGDGESDGEADGENDSDGDQAPNLYAQVRLRVLRTLTQTKDAQLRQWDAAVKPFLADVAGAAFYAAHDTRFAELDAREQFDVLYYCVKHIERRSAVFRHYLGAHLHLFQFPQCATDDGRTLLLLPGGKLVEKTAACPHDNELHVPIKLRNCTLRHEDAAGGVEVMHLDFGPDIDAYLARIAPEFTPIACNWTDFVDYAVLTKDRSVQEFMAAYLPVVAAHELQARRILQVRERERSMAALLVRRKRSSRLVAREEETQRRELEARWLEKLDERDQFLRARQRAVAKHTRAVKDTLWSLLWDRFEQDLRVEKLRRRAEGTLAEHLATPEPTATPPESQTAAVVTHGGDATGVSSGASDFTASTAEASATGPAATSTAAAAPAAATPTAPALSGIDSAVLEHGEKFQVALVEVDPPQPAEIAAKPLELPEHLLVTRAELQDLEQHGIPVSDYDPDSTDWLFQCPCSVAGVNLNDDPAVQGSPILCCDACLRWQHWECQREQWLALQASPTKQHATVVLGAPLHHRRSSRRQHSEEPSHASELRPTDKRAASSQSEPFMCAWCMRQLETDLRGVFIPELMTLRAKQRKQHDDRERRKKLKEERRLLEPQLTQPTQQPQSASITSFNNT
ncbi:LAFE_0H09076g1_1 [Lachancea fermentati]|uniref:LAFE_0H09076g1_1 n=1 Tax=Lachancea fermentati TaxID=4955 RepID=A0A1G4MK31_LACFM|nr:LAFE_0H09076g1_1 [Lachancea fermentati]